MTWEEYNKLEDKNKQIIQKLNLFTNPTCHAPLPTQVEAVENTQQIIHEEGKTVRFNLTPNITQQTIYWRHNAAKRQHQATNTQAKMLLPVQRCRTQQASKQYQKRERQRKIKKQTLATQMPSIVVDSAATSTCIRPQDVKHTNITTQPSGKIFYNANGTISPAGKVTQLDLPLRHPALRGEVVPGLALNSLLSSSKCADANYITLLTPEDV